MIRTALIQFASVTLLLTPPLVLATEPLPLATRLRTPKYVPTAGIAPAKLAEIQKSISICNAALDAVNQPKLQLVFGVAPEAIDVAKRTPVVLLGRKGRRSAAFAIPSEKVIFVRDDLARAYYQDMLLRIKQKLPAVLANASEQAAAFSRQLAELKRKHPGKDLIKFDRYLDEVSAEARRLTISDVSYPRFLSVVILHELGHVRHQHTGSSNMIQHAASTDRLNTDWSETKKKEGEADAFAAVTLYRARVSPRLNPRWLNEIDLCMHPFWLYGYIEITEAAKQPGNDGEPPRYATMLDLGLTHEALLMRTYRMHLALAEESGSEMAGVYKQVLTFIEQKRKDALAELRLKAKRMDKEKVGSSRSDQRGQPSEPRHAE